MAYQFDGSSQYLEVSSAVANRPCTLAASAYLNAIDEANDICSVCSKTTLSVLRINIGGGGQFRIADQGNVNAVANGSIVSAGQWSHFAGVFASGSSRTAYTNGIAGTEQTTTVASIAPTFTSIGAFFPGNTTPVQFFNGRIAEVGFWNVALTSAEIASLAKGFTCNQVRPQSLVFYAPLVNLLRDEADAKTIANNGGATVANHPRVYT